MLKLRTAVAGALASCVAVTTLTLAGATSASASGPIRIDAGASKDSTVSGAAWSADRYAVGGQTSTRGPITGDSPAVLESIRYGMSGYAVPVSNGTYDVTLLMAETWHTAAGKRVFDVSVEGEQVLSGFDVHKAAGGSLKGISRTFTAEVRDGRLDVGFTKRVDNPTVSGIVITPKVTAPALPTVHVDSGATAGSTTGGISWSRDHSFVGGSVSVYPSVSGTTSPATYGSIRYGMSGYDLVVPDGTYDVTLRMTEPYFAASGKRVFDVKVEDATVLERFDIHAAAGGKLKAVDRTFRTTVTGGRLDVDFVARTNFPAISALSVVPAPTTAAPAPAPAPTTAAPAPAPTTAAPAPAPTTAAPAPAPTTAAPVTAPVSGLAKAAPGYPFSDSSVWRQSVAKAPLHPNSANLVKHLSNSVTSKYNGIATFNVWNFNSSYYVADAKTPRVTVKFDNCQNKSRTPSGLFDGAKHFVSVPVPADAVPATGTDGALVIYSPSSDQLWEFWRASKRSDGWYACWGGRMDSVSTNIGHFEGSFGTTATGLPHAAGQISLADVRSGSINHAMALILAEPKSKDVYSWPAQRSDGWSTHKDAVPEGLRLRLDPSVNVDSLNLHPVAKMVARSAQTYGFIVVDRAGATGVYTESGIPEKKRTGTDPWVAILGKTPSYEVMKNFPWHKMQAMPVNHGKP